MSSPKSTPTIGTITTGETLTIAVPDSVVAGDTLVVFIRSQSERDPDTVAPVGWVRASPDYEPGVARMTAAFIKEASASEPVSYDWTTGARAVGVMAVYSQNDVEPVVIGRTASYRGDWEEQAEFGGRRAPAYALSDQPGLQFVIAASEFTDSFSHLPEHLPAGYDQVGLAQTGTGTVGSRTGIWAGSKDLLSTGESVFLSWGHPTSAEAIQTFTLKSLTVPPAPDPYLDGSGSAVSIQATDASGGLYTPDVYPMYRGFSSVDDMLATPGFTWAHRGGGARYPEMSLHAYTQAVRLGYGVLEVSFGRTSDGVWVGLHDNDINRASGTSGLPNINAMTWAQVQSYQITIGQQGAPQPYMRWEDIRDTYGQSHILVLDPKNYNWGSYQTEFLDMCDELGPERVIVKQWAPDTSLANAATARGYQCWGHGFDEFVDDPDVGVYMAAWTILGLDIGANSAAWDLVKSTGKPIVAHIAQSQSDYDSAMSKGATGVQCAATHLIRAVGPNSPYQAPSDPQEPVDTEPSIQTTVAFYDGTVDGADDVAWSALGTDLGAAVSYYTANAKQGGVYVLRSWDQTRISRGILPIIHLQSVAWNSAAGANVQYYPWADVAAGVYDDEFVQWANALKDAPEGISFSFDGEPEVRLEAGSHQPVPNPNASDTTWPAGWPQNDDGKNTPAAYAAAQRRIYDVMHPIAPNVNYRFWFAGHLTNAYMESFYPGDNYVDSIGIDPYVWMHNPADTTPKQKYEPIVSWIRSRTWGQGKPIGISETGIDTGHGEAAGVAFWQAMPQACRDLQLSWVTLYNRSNWRITPDDNPLAWAAYIAAMKEIAG